MCVVTMSARSDTSHLTSAIASTSSWRNSSASPTTSMSSLTDYCPYECAIEAVEDTLAWNPEILTQVVATETVIVEILHGHQITITVLNSRNSSSFNRNFTVMYVANAMTVFVNDTTSVNYGGITLLVLQAGQWIMLMQKLFLAHGLNEKK